MLLKSRWRSHESGVKPGPLIPDRLIQAISLLNDVEKVVSTKKEAQAAVDQHHLRTL
jgi:hypothetical protein